VARNLLAIGAVLLLQAPIFIPFEEAVLPPEGGSYRQISPDGWPAWVAKRDAEIRGRLARGDEDSLVYLWLYGTSYTKQPRATAEYLGALRNPGKAEALLIDRLDDLVAAIAAAGTN
jgi:hypothetical protein